MVDVPLHYESVGSGDPVVLLHAGIADASMWDDQVPAFAERYRVIRFDAQGFGRSPAAPSPQPRAGDVYDLLRALDVARAHVVGVSMGGAAAIDFAVEHPDMVGTLIPVAAGLSGYTASDPWLEEREALEEAAIERGDVDAAVEVNLRVWLAGPARRYQDMDPTLSDRVARLTRHALERGAERKPTPQIDPPAAGRLGEVTAPTLVIVGDRETQLVIALADLLAQRISGARKRVFADTPPMLHMRRPAEFNAVVLEFLAAHPHE